MPGLVLVYLGCTGVLKLHMREIFALVSCRDKMYECFTHRFYNYFITASHLKMFINPVVASDNSFHNFCPLHSVLGL